MGVGGVGRGAGLTVGLVGHCLACLAWDAMDLPLEGSDDTLGIVQPGHFRIAQDVGCPAMGVSNFSNEGIWRKVANRFGYVQQAVHTRKPMQQPYDAVTPCGMCTIGFPASSWVS